MQASKCPPGIYDPCFPPNTETDMAACLFISLISPYSLSLQFLFYFLLLCRDIHLGLILFHVQLGKVMLSMAFFFSNIFERLTEFTI